MEEVEHALPQLEGQRERPAASDLQLLGGLVRLPCRGEEALEVLAVEEVTEQQLPSTEPKPSENSSHVSSTLAFGYQARLACRKKSEDRERAGALPGTW